MAPGAEILLLNCSTFASKTGQTFVQNLGKSLLSYHGGTIRASKNDISIGQVEDLLDFVYGHATRNQNREIGDHWVKGDWIVIPIAAHGPDDSQPCAELAKKGKNKLVFYEHSFELLNPETRQFESGTTMKTATSEWQIDEAHLHFHSKKDDFKIEFYWDQLPTELYAFDPYPFFINALISGGPRSAAIAFTPVFDMTNWKVVLLEGSSTAFRSGVNGFKLPLNNEHSKTQNRIEEGFMNLSVMAVGRDASVNNGEVLGGSGNFYRQEKPGEFDVYFVELQCNGFAKIRWTYVPESSPHLKKRG